MLIPCQLTVDGQSASLTANAVYSSDGDEKTVQYTSQSSFTRDSRRIPVMMKAKVIIGSVTARLVEAPE